MNEKANPITRLLSSSKGLVVLSVCLSAFVALFLKRASWEQVDDLIRWVIGPWLLAVGVEDAAKHIGQSRVDVERVKGANHVEVIKATSLPPPAMKDGEQ